MDIKQLAMAKQAFLQSDFGKIAAEEINKLYSAHHEKAEDMNLEPWRKAYHTERAAGITEVIDFFTVDVALLEAGAFTDKEDTKET